MVTYVTDSHAVERSNMVTYAANGMLKVKLDI